MIHWWFIDDVDLKLSLKPSETCFCRSIKELTRTFSPQLPWPLRLPPCRSTPSPKRLWCLRKRKSPSGATAKISKPCCIFHDFTVVLICFNCFCLIFLAVRICQMHSESATATPPDVFAILGGNADEWGRVLLENNETIADFRAKKR